MRRRAFDIDYQHFYVPFLRGLSVRVQPKTMFRMSSLVAPNKTNTAQYGARQA